MAQEILNMSSITKSFGGVHALKNAVLSLRQGEVHGLIGENGTVKSTLMNILTGIHKPDSGTIEYKGQEVSFKDPADALRNGIAMIHQEISLVPEMSIVENIWLGQEERFIKHGIINHSLMESKAKELLDQLQLNIDVNSKVSDLSIANMQLVEVARAFSYSADIIIMDEPTSALTVKEIDILYDIVRKLVSKAVTIVFISHKLPELFRFCDRLTVMRDGEYIESCDINELDTDRLMKLIVGRKNIQNFVRKSCAEPEVVLSVKNLTAEGYFDDISFDLHKGEILGFSGLMGAGRTEIMDAIFGAIPYNSGEMYVLGEKRNFKHPQEALASGVGMITEDRLRTGSIKSMSILQNSTIAALPTLLNKFFMIEKKKEKEAFLSLSNELLLKYGSFDDGINSLSGGNQQKVIFLRWLLVNCSILILDEPTRGIDVGAKTEIYKIIDKISQNGISVLLVSSEMQELLTMCDRICVIRDGRLVFECNKQDASQELLIKHAFGA